MRAPAFPALLMASTLLWVAPAAGAQEAPDVARMETPSTRCDRGVPMPTPFPDLPPTAPMPEVQPTGPPPVPIPNLCDAPAVAALVAPRSSVQLRNRPLPMGDPDQLRQRYDLFQDTLDPALLQRIDPGAPGADRLLRDVEPHGFEDRWIPYPDLHAPDRLILRPDMFPLSAPDLPPVALPAARE